MILPSLIALSVFPAALIVAAAHDVSSFTIPNRIPLLLLGAFLPAALAAHAPAAVIGVHLAAGLAALLLGMGLFALGWCGGGDSKLMAATILWLGWPAAMSFAASTAIAGGGLALALITLRRGVLTPLTVHGPPWIGRLVASDAGLPYGVAIACGGLMAFTQSDIVRPILFGHA